MQGENGREAPREGSQKRAQNFFHCSKARISFKSKKVLDRPFFSDTLKTHNMNKLFAILLLAAVGFAFATTSAQAAQTSTMTLAKVKKHHRHHGHRHHKRKHLKA
jgi:hypothetical protein